MNQNNRSNQIIREIAILFLIIGAGYLLELVALYIFGESSLIKPFWNNEYFYLFWNNSIRENAQIIKVLGYPAYTLLRLFFWFLKFITSPKIDRHRLDEAKVKEILESIIKEIKLKRKIDNVEYRPSNFWYIVRFYSPPNAIIPKTYINDYINSKGNLGKQQIIDCLFQG